MNTENKDKLISEALKSAHSEIQSRDSWEALRARIDEKISRKDIPSVTPRGGRNVMFWRRTALAMAACFVITSALLIYVLRNIQNVQQQQGKGVLSQVQLYQLSTAFSQVRRLFDDQFPWMVVDAGGQGEIGITTQAAGVTETDKVIILRLSINTEGSGTKSRYFDIVAFSNQEVNFHISMADISEMEVYLKPTITKSGKIAVEINTKTDGALRTNDIVTVSNNLFTSLVRVPSKNNWVNICAAGQSVSNI